MSNREMFEYHNRVEPDDEYEDHYDQNWASSRHHRSSNIVHVPDDTDEENTEHLELHQSKDITDVEYEVDNHVDTPKVDKSYLHQYARSGDFKGMQKLLNTAFKSKDFNIDIHDKEGLSALHYAARFNHLHIVKLLVERGADVNNESAKYRTPLHMAACYKRAFDDKIDPRFHLKSKRAVAKESAKQDTVINYLVSKEADVHARDHQENSPLQVAAMRGNEVAVKELLDYTNLHPTDEHLRRTLCLAVRHHEFAICKMVLNRFEYDPDLIVYDEFGPVKTPFHYACEEGNKKLVKLLLKAAEKSQPDVIKKMMLAKDENANNPLHLAIEKGNPEVVSLCLKYGAEVNFQRENDNAALHLAATTGDLHIVRKLLNKFAAIDAADVNGYTALHRAAAYNHCKVAECLITCGALVECCDKDNFTPLLVAASQGHPDMISVLLNNKADFTAVDKNDRSVLFWTASENWIEALKLILDYPGSRVLLNVADRTANTPLHIAAQSGHERIVNTLIEAGANIDAKNEKEETPFHVAVKHGQASVVQEIVQKYRTTVLCAKDLDGNRALHLAAAEGHKSVLSVLLDAGANIDAKNNDGATPLHLAAEGGWVECCRILLNEDADIDAQTSWMIDTPLHFACAGGHTDVVELFLKTGADVGKLNVAQENALEEAISNGHQDAARLIIESDKWLTALNKVYDNPYGDSGLQRTSPLRELIDQMPDIARIVFNKCITPPNVEDSAMDQAIFYMDLLDDTYLPMIEDKNTYKSIIQLPEDEYPWDKYEEEDPVYDGETGILKPTSMPYNETEVVRRSHPLMVMVRAGREDLLQHPLVKKLIDFKWSYGRIVYFLNLGIYCIFLALLTAYILVTPAPYHEDIYELRYDNYTGSFCEHVRDSMTGEDEMLQHWYPKIAKYIIMVMVVLSLFREIFQMFHYKWSYFTSFENLIEWATYIFAFLLVVDLNECSEITGLRTDWQWQVGAVGVFLAWMDLVLFLRKLSGVGIYVIMFTDVLSTFIGFFKVFILFIFAFAVTFTALVQNQGPFGHLGYSLVKTSVMMIGELDHDDIFHGYDDSEGERSETAHETRLYYEITTFIMFMALLILMSIIIMNLLVGLAVDNIQEIQNKAALKRLTMRAELVLDVELALPNFFRRRFVRKWIKVPLQKEEDKKRPYFPKMSKEEIKQAKKSSQTEMEQMHDKVVHLNKQMDRMESMMSAIIRSQNIEWHGAATPRPDI